MGLETEAEEFERCVLCEELTNVKKETPINQREYYVEFVGQLDGQCYLKTYNPERRTENYLLFN